MFFESPKQTMLVTLEQIPNIQKYRIKINMVITYLASNQEIESRMTLP